MRSFSTGKIVLHKYLYGRQCQPSSPLQRAYRDRLRIANCKSDLYLRSDVTPKIRFQRNNILSSASLRRSCMETFFFLFPIGTKSHLLYIPAQCITSTLPFNGQMTISSTQFLHLVPKTSREFTCEKWTKKNTVRIKMVAIIYS